MKKIATLFAMLALVIYSAAPVAAVELTLEISGNGADSHNGTSVSTTNTTAVVQSNNANISNTVIANSNTGSNSASRNTGGDVTVDTGNSKTMVAIENAANSNTADVHNCGTCGTDAKVTISGNGTDSNNYAGLKVDNATVLAQTNSGDILNAVKAGSSTGENKANRNTGGDVEVSTGNAITMVDIENQANSNWARISGSNANHSGVNLMITGNGDDSKNEVYLELDREVLLQQRNEAAIANMVDAFATTGENKASRNTGGSVMIDTGDALSHVAVDNAANFNWANVDCDCLSAVNAKIAGNGTDAESHVKAQIVDGLNVFQDNSCGENYALFDSFECGISNGIASLADTGVNKAKYNTGPVHGDPAVYTGNAESWVLLENQGNSNTYGAHATQTPNPVSGVNVNITFNLSDLLGALGLR